MGQPTHGLTQRVGKCQMWQHMSFFSQNESSFGENMFKLQLSTKLATLFFLSLVFLPKHNFWLSSMKHRRFFFNSQGWYRHIKYLPTLNKVTPLFLKYFERQGAKPLFRDGETTVFSLAYTHRRLRVNDLFWCQPRCFRVEGSVFLLLRALNVLEKKSKLRKTRSRRINSTLKPFLKKGKGLQAATEVFWF